MLEKLDKKKNKGFTLLELMIVVTIIGILTAVAFPSYQQYVRKAGRVDATNSLTHIANLEQAYFMENRAYTKVVTDLGLLKNCGSGTLSSEGYYCITISLTDDYTLTATPQSKGGQSSDTSCKTLTYNAAETKGSTGGGTDCWGN